MADFVRKLCKLARLLRVGGFRRGLRHRVAAAIELDPLLHGLRPAAVIDVGANVGQFALLAATRFPGVPIHAFEPQAEAACRFGRLFAGRSEVRLYASAVGREAGEAVLHVSGRADCSSLLPIGEGQARVVPGSGEVGRLRVPVRPLDSVPELEHLPRPILLKLDVQGGELDALAGAVRLLDRVDHVLVELSFVPLYDGQPLAGDVIDHLRGAGFAPAAVNPPWIGTDGRCLQADFRFDRVRDGHSQPEGGACPPPSVVRAVLHDCA